jgi:predicted DCC family thiol-disulfide oxidoreductase YuxK
MHIVLALYLLSGIVAYGTAYLFVPRIIEHAYHESSFSVLNAIIAGRAAYPLSYYVDLWHSLVLRSLALYLIVGAALISALVMTRRRFFDRFVGEATPGTLGAIRMWTCFILLLVVLWENLPSSAWLPPQLRQPMGLVQPLFALSWFQAFLSNESSLRALEWALLAALFSGAIGLWTRPSLVVAAILYLVYGAALRQYTHFFHQGLVPFYLLLFLTVLPSSDGWSVDRLWKVVRNQASVPAPAAAVYGWGRYLCWMVIAIAYMSAAVSKIKVGGILWWDPTNLRSIFYTDTLNPNEFNWSVSLWLTSQPDMVVGLLGLTALLGELGYGCVLFFRWARTVFPLLMLGMHIGIFLLQNVLFFDLILLQIIFFDWTALRTRCAERLSRRRGHIEILYDGRCPLCLRTVRVLTCIDVLERLRFVDFRRLDLDAYNTSHRLHLTVPDLDREMYVLDRGQVYVGFYGYRRIAGSIPLLWPVAPWLYLPIISHAGNVMYRWIAKERLKLVACDASCRIQEDGSLTRHLDSATHRSAASLITLTVTLALSCLVYDFEYYPLSAYPMYAGKDESGVVTYFKVWARTRGGERRPARLEETIRATGHNRYVDLLWHCFSPEGMNKCRAYLTTLGRAYNRHAGVAEQVATLEVEEWTWRFRKPRVGLKFGDMIGRVSVPILPDDKSLDHAVQTPRLSSNPS